MVNPGAEELILWDVIEEHFEEACFLYVQRERALRSPLYTLEDVKRTVEARLLAHLDGLVVGGTPVAERTLIPALREGGEEASYVATFALLAGDLEEGSARLGKGAVLERIQVAEGADLHGMQRALETLPRWEIEADVRALLQVERAALRAAALRVLGTRGLAVQEEMPGLMKDADPLVHEAALEVVGKRRLDEYGGWVRSYLRALEPEVVRAALRAGMALKLPDARETCREAVRRRAPAADVALVLLGLGREPEDEGLLIGALQEPGLVRAALFALGFMGTVGAGEACLPFLRAEDEVLAKVAGESVGCILGIDLEEENITRNQESKDNEDLALEKDDLEACLDWIPENDLPLPDAEKIALIWNHLLGARDVSVGSLPLKKLYRFCLIY